MHSANPCGFDFVLKITLEAFAIAERWDYFCFYAFSRATFVSAEPSPRFFQLQIFV